MKTATLSKMPEHAIWRGILKRCSNPNVISFPNYGGRGIAVCERWRSFENFLADMGPRPTPSHSVERLDVERDYEPGNCVWGTVLEQANNKRNTRKVVYRGKEMALCNAVRAAGDVIHREAAWVRIRECGWSVEDALETPRLHLSPNSKSRRRSA